MNISTTSICRGGSPRLLRALLLAGSVACPAYADTPVEEIVVTALKRETGLLVTPMSISAVTGDILETLGAYDFNAYFRQVPGLTTIDGGSGRKRYIIRGVNNLGSGLSQATVAQYLDEVPITNNFDQQPDPYLVDIDRVEVLRGPQGTLFGARSMAGTVRTITRKPVIGRRQMRANATVSDTRFGATNANADATVNLPVTASSAVRASVFYSFENGTIDNNFLGGTFIPNPTQIPPGIPLPPPMVLGPSIQENFSDVKYYGGRAAWRWTPGERWTIDVMGLGQKGKIAGVPFYEPVTTGDERNGLLTAVIGETGNDDTLIIGSATVDYKFDWAELTAIASYNARDNFVLGAANAAGALFGGGPGSTQTFGSDTSAWTFEGRLASTGDTALQWIVGGYGFTQNRDGRSREYIAFGNVTVQDSTFNSYTDEVAAFGELYYEIADRITLTAGARYSDYKNRLERFYITPPPGGQVQPGVDPIVPRFSESAVTLKFGADYQPHEDLLLYAVISEGFRPGGFNANATPGFLVIPGEFTSDSLWNYEIGVKGAWFERRLTASSALYRLDWRNMQVESSTRAPIGPAMIPFTTNASSARIVGLELEGRLQITRPWSVNVAYNHFFQSELTADAPISPIGLAPRAGDNLPGNAKDSFNIGTEYRAPLAPRYDGFARLDWSYTGPRTTGFRPLLANGQPNNSYNAFDGYSIFNARVGVSSGPWRVTAYVDNLSDTRPILQQRNFAPLPVTTRVTSKPRTFGVSVSTNL